MWDVIAGVCLHSYSEGNNVFGLRRNVKRKTVLLGERHCVFLRGKEGH